MQLFVFVNVFIFTIYWLIKAKNCHRKKLPSVYRENQSKFIFKVNIYAVNVNKHFLYILYKIFIIRSRLVLDLCRITDSLSNWYRISYQYIMYKISLYSSHILYVDTNKQTKQMRLCTEYQGIWIEKTF